MLLFLKRIPFFKVLAIAQTVLLARRHFRALDGDDRRRLRELVRKGRGMSPAEREELQRVLAKLEPREFAFAAADQLSPFSLRRFGRR